MEILQKKWMFDKNNGNNFEENLLSILFPYKVYGKILRKIYQILKKGFYLMKQMI